MPALIRSLESLIKFRENELHHDNMRQYFVLYIPDDMYKKFVLAISP